MRTIHQYLNDYPVSPASERLIVGTIHPHNHESFQLPFFYGNVATIWNILSDAFPNDLQKPLSLEGILAFLEKRKIAVSDTIKVCERTSNSALDEDLIPVTLNHELIADIKNSNITQIFFTSGFSKNNAFKLFYEDILGQRITQDIRQNREILLNESFFGRPVKLTVLYSPSNAANRSIVKSKSYLSLKDKYKHSDRPIYDFKVDYYRNMLS